MPVVKRAQSIAAHSPRFASGVFERNCRAFQVPVRYLAACDDRWQKGKSFRDVTPDYFEIRKWPDRTGYLSLMTMSHTPPRLPYRLDHRFQLIWKNESDRQEHSRPGCPFKILGVGCSSTGRDQDDFLVVPITTAQKRISGTDWLDDIYFSATREDIPEVSKPIVALIRERHHLRPGEPDDFNIRTPEEVIRAQLTAAHVFPLLFGGAASLSLNIMLITVTERTREFGLRLAIGATDRTSICNLSAKRSR